MSSRTYLERDQRGFILVTVMMIVALLSFYGLSYIHSSTAEILMAGSDKFHQSTFYTAESGLQVAVGWVDSRYPLPTEAVGLDTSVAGTVKFTTAKSAVPDNFKLNNSDTAYAATVTFDGARHIPGWDATRFQRYMYTMSATATGLRDAETRHTIGAGKVENVGGY